MKTFAGKSNSIFFVNGSNMGKYAIIYIYYIYMCIDVYKLYIYIFKQMSTFNVLKHKKHMIYLKAQIFICFFEALSMWNQITN